MYDFKNVEKKWREYWEENKTFKTDAWDFSRPKYYALDMFPYPSGVGLHAGHPEGYTATDIVSRMKRMQGFNVLHPMGFDSFGLPAEQYAVNTGNHPAVFTNQNIETFKKQLKYLGLSYDWDREISTSDPSFYKWTQWIFIKLFEDGLAKQIDMPVNWCEELGTVLANDEVIDGKSHFFVAITFPKVAFVGRVVIPMLYHLAYKLHCGIILFLIPFTFRLHHHLIQCISGWRKGNIELRRLCRMNQPDIFIISHGRNDQRGLRAIGLEGKTAVIVRHPSLRSSFQIN